MVNSTPRPLYPPERDVVPIVGRLYGPQGLSGRVRKISLPPVFDPLSVQPIASRYSNYTLPAHSPKNVQHFNSHVSIGAVLILRVTVVYV